MNATLQALFVCDVEGLREMIRLLIKWHQIYKCMDYLLINVCVNMMMSIQQLTIKNISEMLFLHFY